MKVLEKGSQLRLLRLFMSSLCNKNVVTIHYWSNVWTLLFGWAWIYPPYPWVFTEIFADKAG